MQPSQDERAGVGEPIIVAEGLIKRYGTFTAVNGVHFTVNKGEVFGLLGPNGAGKTTTMEMIEGLRRPDGGSARVAGFDTQKQLDRLKQVIGVQLQSTSLFDLLKVREIVRMYASFYAHPVEIEPLLDSMILRDKMNDRVKHLSGGQKQRLAIALALVNDPQVVFLDEPTTGLDPQARRTLWDIVLQLKEQGKTIVLSTHYMDEAHVLCDRICLMDSGKVIALDTPEQLVRSLSTESAIEFRVPGGADSAESGETADWCRGLRGVRQVDVREDAYVLYTDDLQGSLTDLIAGASERAITLSELSTRMATLEDVFIHMTGKGLREE